MPTHEIEIYNLQAMIITPDDRKNWSEYICYLEHIVYTTSAKED